jgi:hypothetical protein
LPDINLDITHTKVFLGRADAYPADESLGPHMGTCHSKSVSRRHLTISWDPDRDQWQLYVDSKNGVVVDTKFWEKGKTVDLFHKSAIKFGPCACYFVLPGGEGEPVIAASTVAAPAPPPPPPPPVAVPPPLFIPPPPEPTSVVVQSCVEIKFTTRSSSTPSTRRLLDGVAMPVPHRSTEPARPRHRREMT